MRAGEAEHLAFVSDEKVCVIHSVPRAINIRAISIAETVPLLDTKSRRSVPGHRLGRNERLAR